MTAATFAMMAHPQKTYASYDNAVKAIEGKVARFGDGNTLRYVIGATPDGRFYPIALPSAEQIQVGIALAHNGVPAVRT
jgi:hypothetical protein